MKADYCKLKNARGIRQHAVNLSTDGSITSHVAWQLGASS